MESESLLEEQFRAIDEVLCELYETLRGQQDIQSQREREVLRAINAACEARIAVEKINTKISAFLQKEEDLFSDVPSDIKCRVKKRAILGEEYIDRQKGDNAGDSDKERRSE